MADAPVYSPTGKVISKTANWMRKCNVKIYAHTKDVSNASSDASTYAQQFAKPNEGDVVMDVSSLRCTFDIKRFALMGYPNTALIKIYNLNVPTENSIIAEGYRVTVDAGYPDLYGRIFDGTIIFPTRWKENGTDYVLEILAIDGDDFLTDTYCTFNYTRKQTIRSVVETMAKQGGIDLDPNVSAALDKTLTKGGVVNGAPKNILNDIAKSINGTWYIDSGKLYVFAYSDDVSKLPFGLEAVELSEKTGLIGTPQQNGQGVNARSLLNPKMVPYSLAHISNDKIIQQLPTFASYSQPPSQVYPLDPQGIYRIITVNFIGDTRGGEGSPWYSDINTVYQSGDIIQTMENLFGTIN